jgi:uncharacterized protein
MEENESKSATEYIKRGDDYYNGRGVEKNEDIALSWYKKAAELGDGKASLILGDMFNYYYRDGENHEMAFYWYQKSAELGYAEGQDAVGYMYKNGFGVEENHKKAFYWYKKSADQLVEGGYTGPYLVK